MNSTRRRVRQRLQAACGQVVAHLWSPDGTAPAGPEVAIAWYRFPEEASAPAASAADEADRWLFVPWVLPEGLLLWHPDWGCRWLVQQGVRLPRPEASAESKLRRLRIDRPQNVSGPHAPAAGQVAAPVEPSEPSPPPPKESKQPLAPEGASARAGQDASSQEPRPSAGAAGARAESARKTLVRAGAADETPAGIPALYLELARQWKSHPRWKPAPAVLLCPVEPITSQLHELAIHLAGALAHLEQAQVLVVDFRPQVPVGLWQNSAGMWDLLASDARLDWEPLLRSTAYQRVWLLPRGRRRGPASRRQKDEVARWQQLLAQWQRRFAAVLLLGPPALAADQEQVPPPPVQCCLLAALESSSRQGVLAGYERLRQLGGSSPLCFALPDLSGTAAPPRAA